MKRKSGSGEMGPYTLTIAATAATTMTHIGKRAMVIRAWKKVCSKIEMWGFVWLVLQLHYAIYSLKRPGHSSKQQPYNDLHCTKAKLIFSSFIVNYHLNSTSQKLLNHRTVRKKLEICTYFGCVYGLIWLNVFLCFMSCVFTVKQWTLDFGSMSNIYPLSNI